MTKLLKVKLQWSGFNGGPGYSIFHFRDFGGTGEWDPQNAEAELAGARVNQFADAMKFFLPPTVKLQVQTDVEVIEDTTGEMQDIRTANSKPIIAGTASATSGYAAAVGAVINWRTSTVRRGRRIKGRTFCVPLSGACFETDGTLAPSVVTSIKAAGEQLASPTGTPDLGVYARPHRTKNTDGSWTTVPDGQWAPVQAVTVPDMGAILTSRRD
jgi:hypothetical protein